MKNKKGQVIYPLIILFFVLGYILIIFSLKIHDEQNKLKQHEVEDKSCFVNCIDNIGRVDGCFSGECKIKLKCTDCGLEFKINIPTGRYTIYQDNQLCCPVCQFKVYKIRG